MKPTWKKDKDKTDLFMPHIKMLHVKHCITIREGTWEEDARQAIDLRILTIGGMTSAVRIRDISYASRYPFDVTMRYRRKSGADTEFQKLTDGKASMFFYGFAEIWNPPVDLSARIIRRWIMLDMKKVLGHWARTAIDWNAREKSNDIDADGRSGSTFIMFSTNPPVSDITRECVIACSDGYFDGIVLPVPSKPPAWLNEKPQRPAAIKPPQGKDCGDQTDLWRAR